ncbi:MAG: carboxylesterase/lipase family protein [Proteobacteria bacterium]|nr:carboxylesterase/lipase family protein [Pseudomonadota bacterium]
MDLQADDRNEDCLFLNVTTPGTAEARRPVFVWIHGGHFSAGAGSQATYDGTTLSRRGDVVVVTINYRLGPLGFLRLKEITGGRIPSTGNEGLLDQIMALEWVGDNISAFGGDPNNVTLAGESAGGMSVGSLMAMPRVRGFYHKAILQSGAASTGIAPEKAVRVAEHFLDLVEIKADDMKGLRSVVPEKLLKAAAALESSATSNKLNLGTMPMQPVIDGSILPAIPLEAISDGSADGTAVLVGSTLDEWKLFAPRDLRLRTMDEAGLLKRCRRLINGGDAEHLVETYRNILEKRGLDPNPRDVFTAIQTDRIFRMPAIRLVEVCRQRRIPAYNYMFTWKSPAFRGALGACHALELGFVFGTYSVGRSAMFYGKGPAADALARKIQDPWLAFIRNGDPSCDGGDDWPVYGDARETMLLGETCGIENAPYEEERRIWDTIPDTAIGSL